MSCCSICLVLAAGQGTRMKSDLAKVLHPLCGKPLVDHVVRSAQKAGITKTIVVIGHQAETVKAALSGLGVEFVMQQPRKGTGHAVMQALPIIENFTGDLLVLYGDVPLIKPETIRSLLKKHRDEENACTMLTTIIEQPGSYGRIIRDKDGMVSKIVEAKDASPEELAVKEINPAIYAFDNQQLVKALSQLTPNNKQGEYYLTDVIGIFKQQGLKISGQIVSDSREVLGINTPEELAVCEEYLQR
ncbi:MAG: NTP transferase domain-containing protein [Candidatus Edwardsbacteria bacterium]|nr:NTP transferase domain-containing protein [Candidatus Edwardsbacteria bacterium]MBU1576254.1 NTP transferase domain-containing protein [Candidatus Edwardsbacteria bacterium]MBU2462653.1 NTP transferase domain-containing protein [Candidatus Edwardsbacteria bacterium]MBU2594436.1 NTP transferase domain-containing protein [Candidatus Edwardsbacteria bacterium]